MVCPKSCSSPPTQEVEMRRGSVAGHGGFSEAHTGLSDEDHEGNVGVALKSHSQCFCEFLRAASSVTPWVTRRGVPHASGSWATIAGDKGVVGEGTHICPIRHLDVQPSQALGCSTKSRLYPNQPVTQFFTLSCPQIPAKSLMLSGLNINVV